MSIVSLCCHKAFCYGYTSPACSNSAQDFSVPPPPNIHLTLSSLSREVFSRHGLTVGPGFIVGFIMMQPKISLCLWTVTYIRVTRNSNKIPILNSNNTVVYLTQVNEGNSISFIYTIGFYRCFGIHSIISLLFT